jgi:hypothetical protein
MGIYSTIDFVFGSNFHNIAILPVYGDYAPKGIGAGI